ncbi:hypothetical protein CLIM01_01429 [Colletotrichum limetticola]|uniref:Uncharacterized protein n=1 Tax=Colletotrichum limetticola TaxID=1209924 RepID=A0ABQ9QBT7_9PEZI|nr:hypothetical protein CLIM01_01429 [Colletotrichum limetticola]
MQFTQLLLAIVPFIGVSQAILCSCDRSTTASITCCPDIQKWSMLCLFQNLTHSINR